MIWYFIEGFYHRKNEGNFSSNDYLIYAVDMPGNSPATIRFFKSKLSEKWWLEIPVEKDKTVYGRNCLVPCGYGDYELATQGEVPERYINTLVRLA